MNTQPKVAIRRRYPQKPVDILPLRTASKTFDSKVSLSILSDFVKEVRKQIRKNNRVLINAKADDTMSHLHFVADGFELSFILTEGGTVK